MIIWGRECFSVGFSFYFVFIFFKQLHYCWACAFSVPIMRKYTSCYQVGRWWWRASEGTTPRREGCSSVWTARKERDAGIPIAGLFLDSALRFHLSYWSVSRENSVAILGLEQMEGKRIFSSRVLCVCSNASSRAGGASSSVPIPFFLVYVRALHAVAELLQPRSQRSSFCLHPVLPTIAAAGSCLKQQQRETAIVKLVMIMQIPVCCASGEGSCYLTSQ